MTNISEVSIDKIIENLIHIHPLLSKGLTRSIRAKTNLNPGSLFVIGVLSKHNMLSMSEIGCKLSMPKPHVTAQIDKLIAEGMVERLFDPNDRRIINIKMTEKGKEDFKAIKAELSRDLRERIEKLEEQKMITLFESTQQVRNILSEIMDDSGNTNSCSAKNKE
ncbi:MAG: MarR family transcriptional regulator [Paludibacter sp.]